MSSNSSAGPSDLERLVARCLTEVFTAQASRYGLKPSAISDAVNASASEFSVSQTGRLETAYGSTPETHLNVLKQRKEYMFTTPTPPNSNNGSRLTHDALKKLTPLQRLDYANELYFQTEQN